MKKLPDLEALAIFATVAKTGSFSRAAAELEISQATVSKAVSRLESRMQIMLFHRTSRRMSLTETGQLALQRATRILEEAETLESEITEQSTQLRGTVRISAPMSFGITRLAPILPDFIKANPEVNLDVRFSDQLVDVVAEGFDLALRIANLIDSSLLARRICLVRVLLVGSPDYFARYGYPRHPRDLVDHKALQYSYSPNGSSWRFRHPSHGDFTQTMPVVLQANNSEGLLPALLAGLGVALQPEFLVWQHIKSGALEAVLCDWQTEPVGLHIVTPPGRSRPARVQALMDYLVERLSQEPWRSEN